MSVCVTVCMNGARSCVLALMSVRVCDCVCIIGIILDGSTAAAKKAHPNGRFWIKLDGTDMKRCLQESLDGQWNGDSEGCIHCTHG